MTQALLYKGDHINRANVVWNIAGSFVYAFASMVLSFLVIRLAGEEQGGIFSFGFSTLGQQLFLVAYFGIRPFHITDGAGEYTFGDYREHRNITCLIALAAGAVFMMIRHGAYLRGVGDYNGEKCTILLLLVVYKVIDGYADVYESEFQRQGSLYLTGKSNFFRTILSVSVFTVILAAFENLLLACLAAVAAQIGGVILFNLDVIHALSAVKWEAKKGQCRKLFLSTGFLFVSVFLDFYIFSSAKYAIDARMNNAASGYFNVIFMPTSVINLAAGFVIRPFLTSLTDCWNNQRFSEFTQKLRRLTAVIAALCILAVGGTLILGRPVLSVLEWFLGPVYAGKLTPYSGAFAAIVLGGGFYALLNLYYYALVIMRRQKTILGIYVVMTGAAAVLAPAAVIQNGISGAAFSYLILMAFMAAGFVLWTLIGLRQGKRGVEHDG